MPRQGCPAPFLLPDMVVDFNTLLPQPEGMDIEHGSMSSSAEDWLKMKDDWLLSDATFGKFWLASRLKEHFATLVDWQADTVGRLKERVMSTPGSLEKIGLNRPYLDQIQRNIAVHGCPTWYEWRNRHWGTKWNAYHQYLNEWSDRRIFLVRMVISKLSQRSTSVGRLMTMMTSNPPHLFNL